MKIRNYWNLRDFGAKIWEQSNRVQRVAISLVAIFLVGLLPFAGNGILATPIAAYDAVLVYPVAIFVLMALGLNIVVGKSGMLDLGYVAFFAIGAYTMALMGTLTSLNTWQIMPFGIIFAMIAGVILGLPTLRVLRAYRPAQRATPPPLHKRCRHWTFTAARQQKWPWPARCKMPAWRSCWLSCAHPIGRIRWWHCCNRGLRAKSPCCKGACSSTARQRRMCAATLRASCL